MTMPVLYSYHCQHVSKFMAGLGRTIQFWAPHDAPISVVCVQCEAVVELGSTRLLGEADRALMRQRQLAEASAQADRERLC